MSDMGQIINSHTVRFERLLPGPIDRVWEHITHPAYIEAWLFAKSRFDNATGGTISLRFGNPDPQSGHEYHIRGTISDCEPPKLIAYSWFETSTDLTSYIRFTLEARGAHTLLVVTHSFIAPDFMPKVGAGWHTHLDILAAVLRGEQPPEFLPQYNDLYQKYAAALAATVVVATAVSPAIASPTDKAYKAISDQRSELLGEYNRTWKAVDDLKISIDKVKKTSNYDVRTQDDLTRELHQKQDSLRKLEYDIRDLEKAML